MMILGSDIHHAYKDLISVLVFHSYAFMEADNAYILVTRSSYLIVIYTFGDYNA